jgi:hypothetical protein
MDDDIKVDKKKCYNKTSCKSEESNSTDDVFNKTELMRLNNGWNDKNERLIISLGENAASYKWMHEKCASYNKFVYKLTNIFLIFLSTSLTAETIFPQETTCTNNSLDTLSIIKKIFVYLVNLLSVLQSFFKSEVTGEKHLNASGSFSNLYHDIQQQMCMFRRDRINATKYVSDCLKQYDTLIINSPDINLHVVRMFKKTFKNTDISLPDIADKIQKIEIITEDVNNGDDYKNMSISSSKKNCNNLQEIHNAFQIQGDITDKELENINYTDLRKKFLKQKSEYEYNRFLQHSQEFD